VKALIQRVQWAAVEVNAVEIARIGQGLLAFVCAMPNDDEKQVDQLLDKLAKLRIFADDQGKMNRSVVDVQGGLLLVPQFTLAADVSRGTRPSFTGAAAPILAKPLFDYAVTQTRKRYASCGFGEFGADMKVSLLNDGPITIWIDDLDR
jgi:D-aminoacyl-tRNA deacylase